MTETPLLVRPLRLKKGFVNRCYAGAAAFLVFGAAALIGYPAWQVVQARKILGDMDLWRRGVQATGVSVEGRGTSHNFILNGYDLEVRYADQKGGGHTGRAKFDTLFATLDQRAPVDVRYDPQVPDHFVLSWAVDVRGGRWASFAFMTILGMGLGALSLFAGRLLLRRLRDARQAAMECEEIELELARIVQLKQYGRSTGYVTYHYLVTTPGGKSKQREVTFNRRKQHTPIFLDHERSRVLAMRTTRAPDRPIVLRSDFYPFDVPEWDRQSAMARLERRRAERSA